MQINRKITDERLGRFLQETDEDVLRSLPEQFDEDRAMIAAIDAARVDGGDGPALDVGGFRAALRRENLV